MDARGDSHRVRAADSRGSKEEQQGARIPRVSTVVGGPQRAVLRSRGDLVPLRMLHPRVLPVPVAISP